MMTGFERYTKKTRRAQFLEEMEQVVPWAKLCALIVPHYPKGCYKGNVAGTGRSSPRRSDGPGGNPRWCRASEVSFHLGGTSQTGGLKSWLLASTIRTALSALTGVDGAYRFQLVPGSPSTEFGRTSRWRCRLAGRHTVPD